MSQASEKIDILSKGFVPLGWRLISWARHIQSELREMLANSPEGIQDNVKTFP